MSVRFVIGRAGTGKTHRCIQAIREGLASDPVDGPRLILLVPEQAGLQMERTILGAGETTPPGRGDDGPVVHAAHRAEVLSFKRLALRVLETTGAPAKQAISEPARAMVLRHLVSQRAQALRYYRRARQFGGFYDKLAGTIAELIEESVAVDRLETAAERAQADDPVRSAKLHDLCTIYKSYLEYLGKQRLDPSQYLQAARSRIEDCPWLADAGLWVDGFASLSGEETATLVCLARLCSEVEITIMMDPTLAHTGTSVPPDDGPSRLFGRIRRTYAAMQAAFADAGVPIADPVLLTADPPCRFRASGCLARVERNLVFESSDPAPLLDKEGPSEVLSHPKNPPQSPLGKGGRKQGDLSGKDASASGVELVALPSRRVEVDYAVSRVCQWVSTQDSAYRYRDIAIIVRDFDPYGDLLAQALRSRSIPFFLDRRRCITHHGLVELIRSLLAVRVENLSLDSVRLLLKSGLMPFSSVEADELENYLLAHGLSGAVTWRGDDWTLPIKTSLTDRVAKPTPFDTELVDRANNTRRKMMSLLDPWLGVSENEPSATGPQWVDALHQVLDRLSVGSTLQGWAGEAEEEGDLDLAEEHRQVWRDVLSFLDDVAYAFGDVPLTVADLAGVVETGLANLTLGLAPPMIDQVLVGSIDRSRHPNIRAAVILGFNDGVFPLRPTEDSILNDNDRDHLSESGIEVKPSSRQRVLDESLLVYTALTRASDAVVVTYATADADGRALRPSPHAAVLRKLCPGLETQTLTDPDLHRATWDLRSTGDLARRMILEFRTRPPLALDDPAIRGPWNELYHALRETLSQDQTLQRAFLALGDYREARLEPASVEKLVSAPLRVSVSQLETYAACPFQHFARYGLKLQERAVATLAPVDVGTVHHAILQDFVDQLSSDQANLHELTEHDVLARLEQSRTSVAQTLPVQDAVSAARDRYMLRRSASRLARMIRAQRTLAQQGKTKPRAAEVPFGFGDPKSLPSLALSTPAGRHILVRGFIDRVDLAELGDELLGVVIDYKLTPDKRLKMDHVYHGLSLQLLGYLTVLAREGKTLAGRPIRPLAALYVSVAPRYESLNHPDERSTRDAALPGAFRPRGIIAAERFGLLDGDSDTSGWSSYYSMYRKKDGSAGHLNSSDGVEAETLEALLKHTETKLGTLADGILDGRVAVNPCRLGTFSPCSWCPMPGVCRYEMGISDTRFLETLTRSDVFGKLQADGPAQ